MNIAILGYGRMGHMVEELALKAGHTISGKADANTSAEEKREFLKEADVAIEFTNADGVLPHISLCLELGVPVVTGSTGWQTRIAEVKQQAAQKQGCVVYGSNFSIGVQAFFRINRLLAASLGRFGYEASLFEAHHIHKLDAPSGTGVTLANQILEGFERYTSMKVAQSGEDASPALHELPVTYLREGEIKGLHEVTYQSHADTIRIIHEAHNREGFASGAILVAERAIGKKGFFLAEDIFEEIFS